MNRVLLAGATGYLARHIARELLKRSYLVRALARIPEKLKLENIETTEVLQAEITQPDSIKDCCKNIDVVILTVGITKLKDGLSYRDVDYQANVNLLQEAQKSRVKKHLHFCVKC